MDSNLTRRLFLTQAGASLGLLYIGSITPQMLAQAHAHAKAAAAAAPNSTLRFFIPDEAEYFDAFSAQIIPTDGTPGAREANVVHCVDCLLTAFDADRQADMKKALKALNEQAAKTVPGATSFAKLTSAQQIEAMKAMEKTREFGIMREYTLVAFFGDPALGGNKDEIGWKLLQFDSTFLFRPPFGYYDAQPKEEKA